DQQLFYSLLVLLTADSHLITVSARPSTLGGIVSPICFAVLRLMTSDILSTPSTGKSCGLTPETANYVRLSKPCRQRRSRQLRRKLLRNGPTLGEIRPAHSNRSYPQFREQPDRSLHRKRWGSLRSPALLLWCY